MHPEWRFVSVRVGTIRVRATHNRTLLIVATNIPLLPPFACCLCQPKWRVVVKCNTPFERECALQCTDHVNDVDWEPLVCYVCVCVFVAKERVMAESNILRPSPSFLYFSSFWMTTFGGRNPAVYIHNKKETKYRLEVSVAFTKFGTTPPPKSNPSWHRIQRHTIQPPTHDDNGESGFSMCVCDGVREHQNRPSRIYQGILQSTLE